MALKETQMDDPAFTEGPYEGETFGERNARYEEALQTYRKFLLNQIDGVLRPGNDRGVGRVYRYTGDYTLLDVTGDGVPELHFIDGINGYTVFTAVEGEPVLLYSVEGPVELTNSGVVVGLGGDGEYVYYEPTYRDNDYSGGPVIYNSYREFFLKDGGNGEYRLNNGPVPAETFFEYREKYDRYRAEQDFVTWSSYKEFVSQYPEEYVPINLTEERNFAYPEDKGERFIPKNEFLTLGDVPAVWDTAMPYLSTLLRKTSELDGYLDTDYTLWSCPDEGDQQGAAYGYVDQKSGVSYYIPISAFQWRETTELSGEERVWGVSAPFSDMFPGVEGLREFEGMLGKSAQSSGPQTYLVSYDEAEFTLKLSRVAEEDLSNAVATLCYTPKR